MSTDGWSPSATLRIAMREARHAKGVAQAELADRIGVPRTAITRIENGERDITMDEALAICWTLEIAPADIGFA